MGFVSEEAACGVWNAIGWLEESEFSAKISHETLSLSFLIGKIGMLIPAYQ